MTARAFSVVASLLLSACVVERDLGSLPDAGSSVADARSGSLVFVTDGRFTGDLAREGGESSGPLGADALCALEARAAGLEGPFRAFITTEREEAASRVGALGPYRRVDGIVVFPGKGVVGAPLTSLAVTATGKTLAPSDDAAVWTGTADPRRCNDFTSSRSEVSGAIGSALADGANWTSEGRAVRPCDGRARLYCFQR